MSQSSSSADSLDPNLKARNSPTTPSSLPDSQSVDKNDYLKHLAPTVLSSLDSSQIQAIHNLIDQVVINDRKQRSIVPKSDQNQSIKQAFSSKNKKTKLIDIRFIINLIFSRFYVVLLVGKDIRKEQRSYPIKGITKAGNMITAFVLIISINLLISAVVLLGLYLLKSALGIDLFPGHISDQIEKLEQ